MLSNTKYPNILACVDKEGLCFEERRRLSVILACDSSWSHSHAGNLELHVHIMAIK